MMKKLTAIALILCLLLTAAGCDLFTGNGGTPAADNGEKPTAINITDTYIHEDPTDIEFDQRAVLYGDKNSGLAAMMLEQYGYPCETIYEVIYAQDDIPVAFYQYIVVTNEDDAKAFQEDVVQYGMTIEVEGCVTKYFKNAEDLEAEIAMLKGMSVLDSGNMEEYVNCMITMDELTTVE